MMDYSNNGVKAALIRKPKNKEDVSLSPIYWRITFKRKQVYFFTGFSYDKKEWDDFVGRDLQKHKDTKMTLMNYRDKTLKPLIDSLVEENNFSFEALDHKLGKSDISTVNDAFQQKIDALNKDYKIGNAMIYKTTFNALMRFQTYRKLKSKTTKQLFIEECISKKYKTKGKDVLMASADIEFDDITVKFLSDCETFLSETGIENTTIGIYMRTLRAIINNDGEAFLTGNRYPFGEKKGKYSIPEGRRKSIALEIGNIWKIEDFQTDIYGLILARDIFVFMFYCNGLNFGDLCRLQYNNINGATGEIVFYRKKTRDRKKEPDPIYAPILPPMIEIINRHGNKEQDGYIFPFLNGIERLDKNEKRIKEAIQLALTPINSSLKVIAAQLGIDRNLSTAYTRNSYMTHLISELYINEIFVKQMVGHSTGKNVTAGYNNPSVKKRREVNSKLLNPNKRYNIISLLAAK